MKRDVRLQRRTPLRARPPAARRPAGSFDGCPPEAVAEAVAVVLAGLSTVAQASRDAGADPGAVHLLAWDRAKQLTLERDSGRCVACGGRATDVHHRVRRGMGGTADPVIEFGTANLICLCRRCHDLCHRFKHTQQGQEMRDRGIWLETWQDPALEPVTVMSPAGFRRDLYAAADGQWKTKPPGRAA